MVAGALATAGGIVFTGDAEGFFTAYDSQTGKDLWTFNAARDTTPGRSPTASTAGSTSPCASAGAADRRIPGDGAPWLRNARRGNTLFVFALPQDGKRVK